ncbi:MAG: succinate dehydrogenase cytochrome b subunit [Acidimicrobiales bacterium]|nr:succinate dehydrogenase cytochrome b subunit [Acidimicrobiales bacterium]
MAQTIRQASGGPEGPIRERKKPLPYPLSLYQTAVGKKYVMALTGVGLLGFVVVHMIGNLHVYEGPAKMAEYAETLRTLGGGLVPRETVLWILRAGLIAMFGLHIHSAYTLKEMSRLSSPSAGFVAGNKKYAGGQEFIAANFASRTMRWTGPIIALYLVFHLADLTWGWVNPDFHHGDPHNNVIESLSNPGIAAIYVVANVALAIHIYHGAWSMFQSLGINNPKINQGRRHLAMGLAGLILVGNLSFPLLTATGVINDDDRECPPGDLVCLEEELLEKEGGHSE